MAPVLTNQRVWEFDRYVRGELKAEGIRISRATSEGQARRMAAELADHGDVLVMRGEPQVDALLRELGRHIFGGRWLDHASDCRLGIGEEPCTCGLSAWLAQFRLLLHEPREDCPVCDGIDPNCGQPCNGVNRTPPHG